MANIIIKDRPLKKLLFNLVDEEWTIGIHKDAILDGQPIANYASANEFGTDTVPQRSFLRSTVAEHVARLRQNLVNASKAAIDLKGRRGRVAEKAAQELAKAIKDKIRDLDSPPNAQSTIDRKGSNNPLIETGAMRDSIEARKK